MEDHEQQVNNKPARDEKGRLLPGNTANSKGPPLKIMRMSEWGRQIANAKKIDIEFTSPKDGMFVKSKLHLQSDKTIGFAMMATLARKGLSGDVAAIKEFIDRTDGKAQQSIDVTTNNESINKVTYNLEGKDPEELRKIKALLQNGKVNGNAD